MIGELRGLHSAILKIEETAQAIEVGLHEQLREQPFPAEEDVPDQAPIAERDQRRAELLAEVDAFMVAILAFWDRHDAIKRKVGARLRKRFGPRRD